MIHTVQERAPGRSLQAREGIRHAHRHSAPSLEVAVGGIRRLKSDAGLDPRSPVTLADYIRASSPLHDRRPRFAKLITAARRVFHVDLRVPRAPAGAEFATARVRTPWKSAPPLPNGSPNFRNSP